MTVVLGTVLAPSGALLIIDAGLLGMWSHERPPSGPDDAVDVAIVGADAIAVGRQLDRQWDPRYVYDVPRDRVADLADRVRTLAGSADARVEPLPARVPPRRRAEHALAYGDGAGQVPYEGGLAGVIGGLPRGELRVVGEPMPDGDRDAGRLRRVWIEVRDGAVARSERFGIAGVDMARLMFVDLDAVGRWQHEEPLDGRADFAFWGRDAEEIARRTGASKLAGAEFGWRDLPIGDAVEHGERVEAIRAQEALRFATDVRPHSHHYQLMEQVRASSTGSGIVALGDARACGFMTTWGDGAFELYRDLDAEGRLLRVRIELGTEQRQRLMRTLEARWSTYALVSRMIVDQGQPVHFMYREAADSEADSGWRLFSGFEDEAYTDDAANIAVMPLAQVAQLDARVDRLLDAPVGSVFERRPGEPELQPVTDQAAPE